MTLIRPGDRLLIHRKMPAIVVAVLGGTPLTAEVIHRHSGGEIIAEEVVLDAEEWKFLNFGSCGSLKAETDPRLRPFVAPFERFEREMPTDVPWT
jgi:hypothetical protein